MKRTIALLAALVLCLSFTACGDDDDDGGGDASGDTTEPTTEATSEDFCDVWPSLDDDANTLTDAPTPEAIDRARELLRRANASAPDEIAPEVDEMVNAIDGVLDEVADGGELSEETFGGLFSLALETIPKIEQWAVDNCPGYEPQTPFGDTSAGSEFLTDDFPDGRLGVPGEDFAAMLNEAFPGGHHGYGGGGDESSYDWEITVDMTADEAMAACESFADALSSHESLTGTLTLHLRAYAEGGEQGDLLVDNAGISPGDPGACVPA